jgi:dipeptidyl aminopeptidase/acylaminoacyl peptidase
MKQFDRDVIAREEEAQYRLLMSKPRQYWIDLYLNKVRPCYESFQAWKHRETVEDARMPVDAERIYIKARDGYELPELIYHPTNMEGQKLPTYFQIHGGGWSWASRRCPGF